MVSLVSLDLAEEVDPKAFRGKREWRERKEKSAAQERLAVQEREERQEREDSQDLRETEDQQDPQDLPVWTACLVREESQVNLVSLDYREKKETQVTKEKLVNKAPPV